MKRTYCDRCGEEYVGNIFLGADTAVKFKNQTYDFRVVISRESFNTAKSIHSDYDLCETCTVDFIEEHLRKVKNTRDKVTRDEEVQSVPER